MTMTVVDYRKNYWIRHQKDAILVFSYVIHNFSSDGILTECFTNRFNVEAYKVRWDHMIEVETKTLLLEAGQEVLVLDKTLLLEKINVKPTWGSSGGMTYLSWKDDKL